MDSLELWGKVEDGIVIRIFKLDARFYLPTCSRFPGFNDNIGMTGQQWSCMANLRAAASLIIKYDREKLSLIKCDAHRKNLILFINIDFN